MVHTNHIQVYALVSIPILEPRSPSPNAGCYQTSAAARGNGRGYNALMSWRGGASGRGGRGGGPAAAGRVPERVLPVLNGPPGCAARAGGRGSVRGAAGDRSCAAVAGAGVRAGPRGAVRLPERGPGGRRAAAGDAGRAAVAGVAGRAGPARDRRVGVAAAGRGDQPGAAVLPRAGAGEERRAVGPGVAVLGGDGPGPRRVVVDAAAGRGPARPGRR